MTEDNEFLGQFENNAELARKLDFVIAQIVGSGISLPPASMSVLKAASERIRVFVHPEAP